MARGLTCCKNVRKTIGFKKNMVFEIPPFVCVWGGGAGGKSYLPSGLVKICYKVTQLLH